MKNHSASGESVYERDSNGANDDANVSSDADKRLKGPEEGSFSCGHKVLLAAAVKHFPIGWFHGKLTTGGACYVCDDGIRAASK